MSYRPKTKTENGVVDLPLDAETVKGVDVVTTKLDKSGGTLTGALNTQNVKPNSAYSYSLGSKTLPYKNLYANAVQLGNTTTDNPVSAEIAKISVTQGDDIEIVHKTAGGKIKMYDNVVIQSSNFDSRIEISQGSTRIRGNSYIDIETAGRFDVDVGGSIQLENGYSEINLPTSSDSGSAQLKSGNDLDISHEKSINNIGYNSRLSLKDAHADLSGGEINLIPTSEFSPAPSSYNRIKIGGMEVVREEDYDSEAPASSTSSNIIFAYKPENSAYEVVPFAIVPDGTTYYKGKEISTFSGSYNDLTNKPVLGTASALNTGTTSGTIPVLGTNGKLNTSVLPALAITDTFTAASQAAMLALSSAEKGDVCVRTDLNKSFILTSSAANAYATLANWQELLTPTDAVLSVNGSTGVVTLNATSVGAVATTASQGLTDTEKNNARTNLGIATTTDVSTTTIALASKNNTTNVITLKKEIGQETNLSLKNTYSNNEITLAAVAATGSYNDLSDKPTIPATNVIPATTTGSKVLISTTTSGTAKWSDFDTAGFLKTNSSGVISVDSNTYTNTSVIPNNNGEIKTKYRVALKGYTGSGNPTWYYKLLTLPVNNDGNYASAIINGRIGGWVSNNMASVYSLAWNRGTPGFAMMEVGAKGTASNVSSMCDLVMYVTSANKAEVYIKCNSYFTFDFDVETFQSGITIDYDGTYTTTTPSGTLTDSLSSCGSRLQLIQGVLYVNGTAVSLNGHNHDDKYQAILTAQTAYSAKGSATKVPQITTNSLGQVTAITEVTITQPTVNDGTLTIQANGTQKGTFTANQSSNTTINITASDLGLSSAMKFLGTSTTAISDGATTNPITIGGNSVTATSGNVVIYGTLEFVWTGSAWELLGQDGSYALNSVTITGTGALGGGGAISSNQTITHNEVLGTAKTTADVYKVKIDKYGHISEATSAGLATVATSGSYADLSNKPTIPATNVIPANTTANQILKSTSTSGTAAWSELKTINNESLLGSGNITISGSGTDTNQKVKTSSVTFGDNDVVEIKAGTNVTVTGDATNKTITIAATDTNTATAVDDILDGSNDGTAITYKPYTTQQSKLSFDTSSTEPTRTDRLNLNGKLYATEVYAGSTKLTGNTGTVTSVSAGTGLSIYGTASTTPTVNIASGYKLPTSSEGLLLTNEYTKTINHFGKITSVYNGLYNRGSFTSNTGSANTSSSCYIYKNSTSTQLAQYTSTGDKSLNINIASSDTTLQIWIVGNAADAFIIADISSLAGTYTLSFTYSKTSANVSTIANIMLNEGSTALSYSTYYGRIVHERDIEAELLWRNGNPSSYFDGKTVTTTDMSRYKYLVITYRQWVEWDVYQTIKLRMNNVNGSFLISGHRFDSNEGVSRKCGRTSNTTIEFGNCYLNNSSTTQNGFIVPIEIYGTNTL